MNEVEFSRRLENIILTLMKDNDKVSIDDDYVICDNGRKVKVKLSLEEV
jgi:hypothetical protein